MQNVEQAYSQLLTLPLHPDLKIEDVSLVCNIIYDNINQSE